MRIGNIDLDRQVMVIAEIGNNHEGDFGRAGELIAAAAEAGADAVKFQTIVPEKLVSATQTQRIEQLRRFQFSQVQFEKLAETAQSHGVMFLSTPFDIGVLPWLAPLTPAIKIASGDNTYDGLLKAAASYRKPIILSTGMATLAEIRRSKDIITAEWARLEANPGLVLLHCVSSYPTPPEQAGLSAITELKGLGVTVGYSDHTIGIDAAILSVGLGARVIEKHFTLDKNFSDFRDHKLSADPADLTQLISRIRAAESSIGTGGKVRMPCETEAAVQQTRRSLHAAHDLPAGKVLEAADIACVRPGTGLPPSAETSLPGRRLAKALTAGSPITESDLSD